MQAQGLEHIAQGFAQRFSAVRPGDRRLGIDRAGPAGDRVEGEPLKGASTGAASVPATLPGRPCAGAFALSMWCRSVYDG
jgi:hypothetical protein